jgi:cytochrome P450
MSQLLRARFGDRLMTDEEIVNISVVLMLASLDTTAATLSNAFGFLAEHPEHQRRLTEHPAIAPRAVEEFLRYEGVTGTVRLVAEDVDRGGVQMKRGDLVMLVMGAINRDPATYTDPDEVDFERENVRHVTFGLGPHRCLGMHLARRTMVVGIQELHAVMPAYRIPVGERLERVVGHVRSVRHLPLEPVSAA